MIYIYIYYGHSLLISCYQCTQCTRLVPKVSRPVLSLAIEHVYMEQYRYDPLQGALLETTYIYCTFEPFETVFQLSYNQSFFKVFFNLSQLRF